MCDILWNKRAPEIEGPGSCLGSRYRTFQWTGILY